MILVAIVDPSTDQRSYIVTSRESTITNTLKQRDTDRNKSLKCLEARRGRRLDPRDFLANQSFATSDTICATSSLAASGARRSTTRRVTSSTRLSVTVPAASVRGGCRKRHCRRNRIPLLRRKQRSKHVGHEVSAVHRLCRLPEGTRTRVTRCRGCSTRLVLRQFNGHRRRYQAGARPARHSKTRPAGSRAWGHRGRRSSSSI